MRDQIANFVPDMAPTRRGVLGGVLGAGFALAAGPAAASAITTDEQGIETEAVSVPSSGQEIPAFLARPKGKAKVPVVLVVQEIFGVHEHIRDVCRRLAKEGYLAIAPELYVRQGDVSGLGSIDEVLAIVRTVPDAQVLADLDATLAYAGTRGGDVARAGVTGFCWGGRVVWLYAAHSDAIKAGVAWYGRLSGEATALQPRHPLDVAASLRAPVLGLYAGQDKGIPLTDVERMMVALTGSPSRIHVYPGAQHGFHADYRPSYDPSAAKDGFARLLAWLRGNGVG